MRYIYFLMFFMVSSALYGHDRDSLLLQIGQLPAEDVRNMHAKALLASELLTTDLDSTGLLLEQSKSLAEMHDHPVEQAAWLSFSGAYNWYRGNRDSALVNYRIVHGMDHPDITNRRAAAAVNLAALFRGRMQPDSTLYYFRLAQALFAEVGDSAGIAHANYSLADNYYRQDNYEMALKHALAAYEYRKSQQDTFQLIYDYQRLGIIYDRLKEYDKSLAHYEKGLDLIEQTTSHPAISSYYNNLSILMAWGVGDLEQAEYYLRKAIELGEEIEDTRSLFVYYSNLGKIYSSKGDHHQALIYHEKANTFYQDDFIKEIVAGTLIAEGDAYMGLGEHEEAQRLFYSALEVAEKSDALLRMQEAHHSLFRSDSLQGNFSQAIYHLQQFHKLHNSIWEQERADRISELQIIHETAQMTTENKMLLESNKLKEVVIENQRRFLLVGSVTIILIVMLLLTILWSHRKLKKKNNELEDMHKRLLNKQYKIKEQNEELDKQKKDLEELNQTKDKFFSIIAHDLKGPFNALTGLLDIMLEDYDDLEEDQKKNMLNNLKKSSINAYDLTANLLEWAKLQMNRVQVAPETFSLKDQVDKVMYSLEFNIQKKQLKVLNEVPAMEITTDPNLVYSVLTNLISNAIKFTPGGGRIVVEARRMETRLVEVCVTDNGMGIKKDKQAGLFSLSSNYRKEGTDGEPGTGIGLLTTREFVHLLGGKIGVTSEENEGSSFCFTMVDHPVTKKAPV